MRSWISDIYFYGEFDADESDCIFSYKSCLWAVNISVLGSEFSFTGKF